MFIWVCVIKDAHTVTVNDEELQTENIVIATGQHSNKLDIEGKELTHDSRDFLSMDELPKHMTFIGVGIISGICINNDQIRRRSDYDSPL